MKRKIVSLTIVFLILISTSSIASAADVSSFEVNKEALFLTIDMTEEISNAKNSIIDPSVPEVILSQVDVGIAPETSPRGTQANVDDYDDVTITHTVKKVGDIALEDGSEGTMYSLTAIASTKTDTGTSTEDSVDCYISITWIDNFGPSNQLVSVSGGWVPNGRTLSDRQVYYGVGTITGSFVDGLYSEQAPSSNTYAYNAPSNYVGLSLRACSWVRSAGYDLNIYCGVQSSIFS